MNWKTLTTCSAIVGLAVGCGSTPPAGDGGTPTSDGGAMTRTYVLSALDSGEALASGTAYGFNLDGMDGGTVGCVNQADYTNADGEPTATGIDNVLSGLLPTIAGLGGGGGTANDLLNGQVRKGTLLLVMQVTASSFTNDAHVTLHTELATVPNSAACSAHTDTASCSADATNHCNFFTAMGASSGTCIPLMVDANGALAANQTLTAGTDLGTVNGTITNGQLDATTDSLPLAFAVMGNNLTLTLHHVHFGGAITATGIAHGQFGAEILMAELVAQANMINPTYGDLIGNFVMPDLDPSATDNTMCAGISAGLGFSAVPATVN